VSGIYPDCPVFWTFIRYKNDSNQRRRLVINIGGQKFLSQILGGKFRENIFSYNILKKVLKNPSIIQSF